jgi:hypothetical protein
MRMPPHFVFENIEQPQNSRPRCLPVLARRTGHPTGRFSVVMAELTGNVTWAEAIF